jgi:hypothetical protein
MTGLNHVLTGTAIALAVKQPLLAAPLAFLSHFLLDVTPHFGGTPVYEYGHKIFPYIMLADGIVCTGVVALLCALFPNHGALICLCVLSAILPDIILFDYYANGRPTGWFHRFHLGIQWFERPQGAIVEASYCVFIATVVVALLARG